MNTQESSPYASHDDVWLLLPWYANASLDAQESRRVAAHLRVCFVCRQELAAQTMLAQRLRHDPLVEISPKPSFERLISRIHAEAEMPGGQHSQDPRRAGPGTAGRLAGWFKALRAGPASPRLAAVCATTLLALAIPLLLDAWPPTRQPAYHTVADAGSLGRYTRDDLRVVFAGQTTKQEISHLIRAVHGDIVDGPNPAGVYTVRLAGGEQGGVERALAQLRASQSVVFAEPALPLAGKPGGGG